MGIIYYSERGGTDGNWILYGPKMVRLYWTASTSSLPPKDWSGEKKYCTGEEPMPTLKYYRHEEIDQELAVRKVLRQGTHCQLPLRDMLGWLCGDVGETEEAVRRHQWQKEGLLAQVQSIEVHVRSI